MKGSRVAKLEQQLAAAEAQLRSQLTIALHRVMASGESLFFNSGHLPEGFSAHWLPPDAEPLFLLSCECVELREQLGLSTAESLATGFLAACAEAASTANPHRRGPRQLAQSQSLLSEVPQSAA
jgi:hypothetical protein